jgi:NMD protein affecting ribosome stability and mRNA decay
MDKICVSCGKGIIKPVSKTNKKYKYKGILITIPTPIEIPTCNHCGAEWFNSKVVEKIDIELEKEYKKIM